MAVYRHNSINLDLNGCNEEASVMIELVLSSRFHTKFKNALHKSVVLRIAKRECDVLLSFLTDIEREICYLLPAVIYETKLVIVFCSEITIIERHVRFANSFNIINEVISSETSDLEYNRIIKALSNKNSNINVLYVTPDHAILFRSLIPCLMKKNKLAFIVVDVAKTELDWVFGAKKEYELVGNIRNLSLNIPWVVLTAIPDFEAINCIKKTLNLRIPSDGILRFTAPCFRSNMFYDVIFIDKIDNPNDNLIEFINQCLIENNIKTKPFQERRGIIYCKTNFESMTVAKSLADQGIKIAPFCHTLDQNARISTRLSFIKGRFQVIAVTEADGIHINKSNLKFIVHWGLPSGLSAYYQQCTEVGKDGLEARSRIYIHSKELLEYGSKNYKRIEAAILNSNSTIERNHAIKMKKIFFFAHDMAEYCKTKRCRNLIFADHFGDIRPKCIDRCDNCVNENTHNKKNDVLVPSSSIESNERIYPDKSVIHTSIVGCLNRLVTTVETMLGSKNYFNGSDAEHIMSKCDELISISKLQRDHSKIEYPRCECLMAKEVHFHPIGTKKNEN